MSDYCFHIKFTYKNNNEYIVHKPNVKANNMSELFDLIVDETKKSNFELASLTISKSNRRDINA